MLADCLPTPVHDGDPRVALHHLEETGFMQHISIDSILEDLVGLELANNELAVVPVFEQNYLFVGTRADRLYDLEPLED